MKDIDFTSEYMNEPIQGLGNHEKGSRVPQIIGIEGLISDLAKEITNPDPDIVKGLDGGEYKRELFEK